MDFKKHFEDIVFEPIAHTYTRKGNNYISVTTLIHEFTAEFDRDGVSKKISDRDGISQEELLTLWDIKRDFACVLGTEFHLYVETYLRDRRKIETITGIEGRLDEFHRFWDKYSGILEIVENELILFDDKSQVAGAIDCLARNKKNGKYIILDWKTNKEIKDSNQWQTMNHPFEHLDDCNFNHYSLQLAVYKEILQRNNEEIEFEVGRLVYFPNNNGYRIIQTKDLSVEAKMVLDGNENG